MTRGDDWKAAILDMDGVITQTADVHARAWKEMFDAFLRERSAQDGVSRKPFDLESDYREYVDGKPRLDGVRSFLKSRGIELPVGDADDPPDHETCWGLGNRKNQLFQQLLRRDGVKAFEDAVEQIEVWEQAGWKLGVISSSRNCEAVMQGVELLEHFQVKVDGQDLERLKLPGKPAPDVFLHAARELGVVPSEAVVVEDAIAGVEAARAGNFGLVVGVARDGDPAELRRAGADVVVGNLREIGAARYCPPDEDCLIRPSCARLHTRWIVDSMGDKRPALFLDYDGTLTPIVRRPEDATLTDAMRDLLASLAELCTVAIVSGRDRRDAEQMVGLEHLVYAGSHGFDVRGPDGLEMEQQEARDALPELDRAETILRDGSEAIDGAHVERKKFAIAVHYREVTSAEGARQVEQVVDRCVAECPGLRKRGGKKIFELQPDVEWNKGYAVEWLSKALGLDPEENVVIYLGDDVTDEDAFQLLRRQGTGIGIRVGDADAETAALYYLEDCDGVRDFLDSLLQVLRNKGAS
jgi:trehalose 6-phosphate phosphatase